MLAVKRKEKNARYMLISRVHHNNGNANWDIELMLSV